MKIRQPLEMLYKWEQETPNKVYMRQPIDGVWHEWTWKETGEEVRKMAAYLKSLNLPAGSKIAMISKNCAHWMISDLAIMMAGYVSVPMYPNLSAGTVKQILEHSEAKLLFVGKLDDWASMKPGVPEGMKCISFPIENYAHKEYDNWKDLVVNVTPISENVIRDPQELATIIYTSGTTGLPKGVMHKFYNFGYAAEMAMPELDLKDDTSFFSYLPLSHIAERVLVEMGSFYTGGQVSFAESLDTFAQNLSESQPTVFLGVPRIWAKFQQGVLAKMPQKKLDLFLKIPILSNIVKTKVKTSLGLLRADNILTGAAPMPVSLMTWFSKLGINIQEAYAMTENCCYSHATKNDNIRVGAVGQPLPECDCKLGENNEILIKHEALMDGYYKNEEATKEAFTEDGYLRTGDEGSIDAEGFLKITGRVKDLFKTSKGKYVAPAPIELQIEANNDLEQVCLVGSSLPQPIVLAVLSETGRMRSKEDINASLEETMRNVNPNLDHHEQFKKIVVMKDEWTVENELLTPTMKIKRNALEKKYNTNYEKWYQESSKIIWEN